VSLSIRKAINRIICGDALKVLKQLPDESIHCVVTSPPYWALRDYGVKGQLGLEPTFQEYLSKLCAVFDEVKRVLKPTGTCWVNMGDTYASFRQRARLSQTRSGIELPPKSLCQIPARFAIEMTSRGWILRNEIIWHKPNCMPSSAKDRFTVDFEKIFFFVKSRRYHFRQQYEELRDRGRMARPLLTPHTKQKRVYGDARIAAINPKTIEASRARILKKGRHKRCVWWVAVRPYYGEHFATYPPEIVETPIKAGCPRNGIVLDPFMGSGTTALVARQLNRRFVGIELGQKYVRLAEKRLPK